MKGENADLVGKLYGGGRREIVVVSPGFTEYRWSVDPLAVSQSEDKDVLAIPLNGHCLSTGDVDFMDMVSSFRMVVGQLRERYDYDRVGVIGNSLSGMVAAYAEGSQPGGVDALCLIASGGSFWDYYWKPLPAIGRFFPSAFNFVVLKAAAWLQKRFARLSGWSPSSEPWYDRQNKVYRLGGARFKDLKRFARSVYTAPKAFDVANDIEVPRCYVIGGDDQALGLYSFRLPHRFHASFEVENGEHMYGVRVPKRLMEYWARLGVCPEQESLLIVPGLDHSLNPRGMTRHDSCLLDRKHHNGSNAREKIIQYVSDFFRDAFGGVRHVRVDGE